MSKKQKFTEKMSDRLKKHCNLLLVASIFFAIGLIITLLTWHFQWGSIINALGISILVGSYCGVFGIILIGRKTGWIFSCVLSLFIGVYISYVLFNTETVFFASYMAPIIGGIFGYWMGTENYNELVRSICHSL